MTTNLKGKRALVTGGSRGIGAAIVRRLAADGAAVAFTYHGSADAAAALAEAVRAEGGVATAIQANSADPAAVQRSVDEAANALGGLDILVLNAGVAGLQPIHEGTIDEYRRIFDVNVQGVFAAVAAAAPRLDDGGSVVVISSNAAHWAPITGFGIYAASKAAVTSLAKNWARDLGPRGIRVNAVQPGPVDTEMNPADGELAAQLTPSVPLGRYGRPEEIAALTAFLAGPESSFITGAAIDIDGGLSV